MDDFTPRRDVLAISHVNVVVDDIEIATEFYRTVLGFEQAANTDGPMDYPGVDLASFARNAGLDDGRVSVDVRFLKHPSRCSASRPVRTRSLPAWASASASTRPIPRPAPVTMLQ